MDDPLPEDVYPPEGTDILLRALEELCHLEEPSNLTVVLLVGGVIIVAKIGNHTAVSRDIWLGLKLNEDESLSYARGESESELLPGVLSLVDVKIFQARQVTKLPFLRVRLSAIDAWFSGAEAQIKSLPESDE